MDKNELIPILSSVVHPETGKDIVSSGIVENIDTTPEKIRISLNFPKPHDPFMGSVKKSVENAILAVFPGLAGKLFILVKEAAPAKKEPVKRVTSTGSIRNIIAVSSGKGGVGKSTVTANLAAALVGQGYRVGVLDADIYGPSLPKMFGVESYRPVAEKVDGRDRIVPAQAMGVELMSIGFFIQPDDALIWRGAMATNALRQLIHETRWGELDFLLIDMPPGTGDIHLTLVQELAVTGAVIVTTPQQVALADVVRGIKMFRSEGVGVPVLGIVENLAWWTPAELPDNRYYIFGRGAVEALTEKEYLPLLAQIPLVQSVSESGDNGIPVASTPSITGEAFVRLAERVSEEIEKRNAEAPPTQKVESKK